MIRIIHNGYKLVTCETMEEVEEYINSVLEHHRNLCPKKIFDRTITGNSNTKGKQMRVVRYKYYTLYEEDFIIDFN